MSKTGWVVTATLLAAITAAPAAAQTNDAPSYRTTQGPINPAMDQALAELHEMKRMCEGTGLSSSTAQDMNIRFARFYREVEVEAAGLERLAEETEDPARRSEYSAQSDRLYGELLAFTSGDRLGCMSDDEVDEIGQAILGLAQDGFRISISGLAEWRDYTQSYLGQEPPGASAPTLDQVSAHDDVDIYGGSIAVELPFGLTGNHLGLELGYSEGSVKAALGDFDPDGDNRFLLPGPEGGPSGLSLGNGPGFPNTASGISGTYDVTDLFFDLNVPVIEQATLVGGLKLRYRDEDFRSRLAGSLPGYDGQFQYDTEVSLESFSGGFFGQVELPLSVSGPASPGLNVLFGFEGNIGTYDIDGEDSLFWSVFNGNTQGGGTTQLDDSKLRADGEAYAGFSIDMGALTLELLGKAQARNVPEVIRNGTDPTTVELDQRFGWGAELRIVFDL